MTKPQSIQLFSRLFWLGVIINVVAGVVNSSKSVPLAMERAGVGPVSSTQEIIYTSLAVILMVGIFMLMWFLIIKRASIIARWAFTLFALLMLALNVASAPRQIELLGTLGTVLEVGRFAIWAFAALLLFRADADRYFRQKRAHGMIQDD